MTPGTFDGFRASSFDAYAPDKWSSNVFTRERLEVKQRLLTLSRALEPVFQQHELALQRYASDEYPSLRNGKRVDAQWVFFWRTEQERLILEREVDLEKTLAATLADPTPMTRHAFLCLRLDHEGLEVSLRLHKNAWVDQHNLLNKLRSQDQLERFLALVQVLPGPAFVDAGDGVLHRPLELTAESLVALAEPPDEPEDREGFLRFGLQLDREETTALSGNLVEALQPGLSAAAGIYRFVAWCESNDHIRSDQEFLERRERRGARRQELEANVAEHRAAHEVKRREQEAARQELEELFRREAAARPRTHPRRHLPEESTPPSPSAQAPEPVEQPRPAPEKIRRDEAPPPAKPKHAPSAPLDPQPLQVGHQARIAKGPFAGQVGLVQEIDSKGSARIMVGLLATRIATENLVGLGPEAARPEDKTRSS